MRVLVLEDDAEIRGMVTHALRRGGFEVDIAENGLEGLEQLSRSQYDAIVLDLAMPGYSGLAIINHLKNISPEMLSRVIVTSAWAARLEPAEKKLIAKVLNKPFDVDDLLRAVQSAAQIRSA